MMPAPFDPEHTFKYFEDHPDEAESFKSDGREGWQAVAYYCTVGVTTSHDDVIREIHTGKHERLIGTVGSYWACDGCEREVPCPTIQALDN